MLAPIVGLEIQVGIDFGLTPAAVFGQCTKRGQWRIIDEFVGEDIGAARFADLLRVKCRREYPDFIFKFTGDPSGDNRAQTDSQTCFQILRNRGIDALPATTNDPVIRQGGVNGALRRMIDGQPGLLISPRCKVTRKGMAGAYCFRRVQVSGDERFHDKPDKNKYSHPCEALRYLLLGGGEGDSVIGTASTWSKKLDYSPMDLAMATTPEEIAAIRQKMQPRPLV